jgi:hypothetical protein
MILCLLSDVCKVHSAVGMVAGLHKSGQFWAVSRQGVELYYKASRLAVGPFRSPI